MFLIMGRLNAPIARHTQEMQEGIGEAVSIAQDGLGGLIVTQMPDLPKGLVRVVMRCLQKQPSARFRTYDELRQALAPFASAAPTPAIRSAAVSPIPNNDGPTSSMPDSRE